MTVIAYYCLLRAAIFRATSDSKLKQFFSGTIASKIALELIEIRFV